MKNTLFFVVLYVLLVGGSKPLAAQQLAYDDYFAQIDSLAANQKARSAVEVINQVNTKARKEGNSPMIIKTIMYRRLFHTYLDGNDLIRQINLLKQDVLIAKQPEKSILQSLLAETLWNYYSQNRYKISQRTPVDGDIGNDVATWSVRKLLTEVTQEYLASISEVNMLQNTSISTLDGVLIGDKNTRYLQPTIYDLLANNALLVFRNTQLNLRYEIGNDDNDLAEKSKLIFDNILKYHKKHGNKAAYCDAQLTNLRFYKMEYGSVQENLNYFNSLQELLKQSEGTEIYSNVLYELALLYKMEKVKVKTGENNLKVAVGLAEKAVKAFPNSSGASYALNLIQEIRALSLDIAVRPFNVPGAAIDMVYNSKNIDTLHLSIYRLSFNESQNVDIKKALNYYQILNKQALKSWIRLPVSADDYRVHKLRDSLHGLPIGDYLLVAQNRPLLDTLNQRLINKFVTFKVSGMVVSSRVHPDNINEFKVYDSKNGLPVKGVKIEQDRQYLLTSKTNGEGFSSLIATSYNFNTAIASLGKDSISVPLKKSYSRDTEDQDETRVLLFTDRPIYRPGQEVFYKGLVLNEKLGSSEIIAQRKLTVYFSDVRNNEISKVEKVSNEYGSFSGSFTIPTGKLNGRMEISTDFGEIEVQVEEYKRPTFEVKFPANNEEYLFNDTVRVRGNAISYAGYPIAKAAVKFSVTVNGSQVWDGVTSTDSEGYFKLAFFPLKKDKPAYGENFYTVNVEVTDLGGETRLATKDLRLHNGGLTITSSGYEEVMFIKKEKKISFRVSTGNSNNVEAKVRVEWFYLNPPQKLKREDLSPAFDTLLYIKNWKATKVPLEQNLITSDGNVSLTLKEGDLKPGYYKRMITAVSDKLGTVKDDVIYRVYNSKPDSILQRSEWAILENSVVNVGDNAVFRLAGFRDSSNVFYEVTANRKIIKSGWLSTSALQTIFKVPINKKYGGFVDVDFVMVQDGEFLRTRLNVIVRDPTKELEVKFLSFRDRLQPGEKETWKLRIGNKAGEKNVELLATLFDASLEAIRPIDQDSWFPRGSSRTYYPRWENDFSRYGAQSSVYSLNRDFKTSVFSRNYERLNNYSYNYYDSNSSFNDFLKNSDEEYQKRKISRATQRLSLDEVVVRGYVKRAREATTGSSFIVTGREVQDAPVGNVEQLLQGSVSGINIQNNRTAFQSVLDPGSPGALGRIIPRTNFSETAFFYPQLRTNASGEINIEFTIPESLTRFRMLGFAHTKAFETLFFSKELVTQKQFAISANAPRFFRERDTIVFSAKLNNMTDKALKGNALLELRNAVTGNVINIFSEKTTGLQNFELSKNGTQVFNWTLVIPVGIDAVTYKVVAESGKYSDGEENTIPILSNNILITEAIPLNIRGNTTKTFTMDKLLQFGKSSTMRNQSLTLEFTSNPIWNAIQALPYLMEYPYECAEQTMSRFYANSFAAGILNSSPKIKQVFEEWQKSPEDSFASNLNKNASLKALLLEESPWVSNAGNGQAKMKRLATLFDLNRMSGELKSNFDKLINLQNADGSFSWFKGMSGNRYITQQIVLSMSQLQYLKLVDDKNFPTFKTVLNKAIVYLDALLISDFSNNKVSNRRYAIPLHYLYARSYSKQINENKDYKVALAQALNAIPSDWQKMTTYEQGLTALVLYRNGRKETAIKIVNSLKERSQHNEEMGMYWPDNQVGWWWYQSPVETQALMIEVFEEVAKDPTSVEELKIWLLKNKQTNEWRTTKATTAACYSLLMRGYNLLDESAEPEITLGGKTPSELGLPTSLKEAGTGYRKIQVEAAAVKAEMGTVVIKNNNQGIAWGGLYWQYFEQADKVTNAGSGIIIKKELFLNSSAANGPVLTRLGSGNVLKKGDLITVRMEIRCDRDMEYMHLKDMRSSGFEPVNMLSGYKYQDGLGYYESTKDASTNFFIDYLRKGIYVFEYPLRVTHSGNFSNGVTTLQSMYAPEFTTHSEGIRVNVK